MFSHTVTINAPAHKVWEVLTDLDKYHEWNPALVEAHGTVVVGSRLRIREASGLCFRPTVLVADPHKELQWIGRLLIPGLADGTHSWTLKEEGGHTVVTQSETFSGILVPILKRFFELDEQFKLSNEALKMRVEQG